MYATLRFWPESWCRAGSRLWLDLCAFRCLWKNCIILFGGYFFTLYIGEGVCVDTKETWNKMQFYFCLPNLEGKGTLSWIVWGWSIGWAGTWFEVGKSEHATFGHNDLWMDTIHPLKEICVEYRSLKEPGASPNCTEMAMGVKWSRSSDSQEIEPCLMPPGLGPSRVCALVITVLAPYFCCYRRSHI